MTHLERAKEFLSQLEPKEGLPEEMHGIRFSQDIDEVHFDIFACLKNRKLSSLNAIEYLIERCRRAESLIIPDAANTFREVMRAAMDAQFYFTDSMNDDQLSYNERNKRMQLSYDFREICEPSSSKEKP